MSENIRNFYYKKYFDSISFLYLFDKDMKASDAIVSAISTRNSQLINSSFKKIPRPSIVTDADCFTCKVEYPGLITGIGIVHEAKIAGEFKLGMHFDYTTGMPIIYGSSVKGVLKYYFDDFYNGEIDKEALKAAIFENDSVGGSSYNRDVFFDAVIVEANRHGRFLETDSITPHKDNPLKNPIPITFLKIASGSVIEFRFRLNSTKIGDKIYSKEEKKSLFEGILSTVGIGAKTNVGYGQLTVI